MTEDGWFGEAVAATYDDDPDSTDAALVAATVDVLAALAGGEAALELAIGTGRVALPLAARGVPVSGIELSGAMIDRLRVKPGGDPASIPVTMGDMRTTRVAGAGSFSLVYLVFNTIMNVTTQDGQVEVFQNAAAHLRPGGSFLIETMVPDLRRLPPGERYVTFDNSARHVGLDEYDTVGQRMWSHHVSIGEGGATKRSVPFRYVWPAELDLMARIAGLRLRDRWADWSRAPFTAESRSHVSVWERPVGDGS